MVLASGDTDCGIARPKVAKRALPDSLRSRAARSSGAGGSDHFYQAGAGTLRPTGLDDGVYRAGSQRNFLKASGGRAAQGVPSRAVIVAVGHGNMLAARGKEGSAQDDMFDVLFLDVDGVLNTTTNSTEGEGDLSAPLLAALAGLVAAAGPRLRLVLSSTWRRHPRMVERLRAALQAHGVGPARWWRGAALATPQLPAPAVQLRPGLPITRQLDAQLGAQAAARCREIASWLHANHLAVRAWAALDDLPLGAAAARLAAAAASSGSGGSSCAARCGDGRCFAGGAAQLRFVLMDPREGLAARGCEAALAALSAALSEGEAAVLAAASPAARTAGDGRRADASTGGAQSLAQLKQELLGMRGAARQRNFLKASGGGKAVVAAGSGGRGRGLPGWKSAAAARRAPRIGEKGYRGPGATYEPFYMRSTAGSRTWKSSTEAVKAQPKGPRSTAAEKGIEIV